MARHRAPRRRGHPPPPPAEGPRTTPEQTPPPWLRVVPTGEDVLAEPPADPVPIYRPTPEVQVVYADGHRVRVPIENGMVLAMACVDGQPTVTVQLNEA